MLNYLALTCLAPQACPKAKACNAPAIALYKDSVIIVWPGTNGQIFYSWKNTRVANTNFDISNSPALAVFNDLLYMVWRGAGDGSEHLYYATFDGSGWSGSSQCNPNYSAGLSPSLVMLAEGGLCMAWRGASDPNIYLAEFNGHTWSNPSKFNCVCDSSPSLATTGGLLFMAWREGNSLNVVQGGASQSAFFMPLVSLYEDPAIIGSPQLVFLKSLYVIFRGADQNGFSSKVFYACKYVVEDWDHPGILDVAEPADDCSVFAYTDQTLSSRSALVAWRDARDGQSLYFCRAAPAPFTRWMHANAANLAHMTLKQMCLPGAHDAGMNYVHNCLKGASTCSAQTQSYSIWWMLHAGVRYFDIRPTWDEDGVAYCGHFGTLRGITVGCYGTPISTVLSGVALFMKHYPGEVIILKFSHYQNLGDPSSDPPYAALISEVANVLEHYLFVNTTGKRLADINFATLAGTKGTVLAVFDGDNGEDVVESPALPGIYTYANYQPGYPFPYADLVVYDKFSNTDELTKMTADQCAKLNTAVNHNADMFLLSWTLTQDAGSWLSNWCIWDLALQANEALESYVLQEFGTSYSPNIIYVDYANGWCTEFCLYVMGWADLSFVKRYKNSL